MGRVPEMQGQVRAQLVAKAMVLMLKNVLFKLIAS